MNESPLTEDKLIKMGQQIRAVEYGHGYRRGVWVRFHGRPDEHPDESDTAAGAGYRDGLAGRPPQRQRPGRPKASPCTARTARVEWSTTAATKSMAVAQADGIGMSLSAYLDSLICGRVPVPGMPRHVAPVPSLGDEYMTDEDLEMCGVIRR